MSRKELDEKVSALMAERAQQDAEIVAEYPLPSFFPDSVREVPLPKESLNQKVSALLEERARQDAEIRSQYPAKSPEY